jgi:hypothetical protein
LKHINEENKKAYPVYCIFIPTGMETTVELEIMDKLKKWGKNTKKNLCVTTWDIGDPSYIQLTKTLGNYNKPAIILTCNPQIMDKSYFLVLDDPDLMKNTEKLTEELPKLFDLLLKGENIEAARQALESHSKSGLQKLLKKVGYLKKLKITVSGFGFTVTINSN